MILRQKKNYIYSSTILEGVIKEFWSFGATFVWTTSFKFSKACLPIPLIFISNSCLVMSMKFFLLIKVWQNSKAKSGDIHKIRRYRIFFDTYPPHIAPYRQFDPPSPPLNWRRRLWMAPHKNTFFKCCKT